jgi:hypothetical protein
LDLALGWWKRRRQSRTSENASIWVKYHDQVEFKGERWRDTGTHDFRV